MTMQISDSLIHTLFRFASNPYGGVEIDTTANSGRWRGLSPFVLGPVKAFAGAEAQNFENFWQFHKVYRCHVDKDGEPTLEWYDWHNKGFMDRRAHRYPMGKGAIPEYSFWSGQRLGYIDARKKIYVPVYAKYVAKTLAYESLCSLYESVCSDKTHLVLRDYDAYDHVKLGMSLKDVINNPDRKMGHSFVLIMMLTNCLEECLV